MSGGELFRIGEVARLFHLSVSTLRHYERLGLVTPERVDPDTGYRYYSARQFEALNTVRYLRALDMPLEEISDFVHNRDLDNIQAKLRQQRETVARKRAELERVQRKIDARLEQLEEARHCDLDYIRLVEATPCRIVWVGGPLCRGDSGPARGPMRPGALSGQPWGGPGPIPPPDGLSDRGAPAPGGLCPGDHPD